MIDEVKDISLYLSALVLAALSIYFFNLWLAPYRIIGERLDAAIRENKLPYPAHSEATLVDISDWTDTDVFQLGDAACLWVGVCPHNPISNVKALATFKKLSGAIVAGNIQAAPSGLGGLSNLLNGEQWWPKHAHKVSAVSLRRYAESTGNVPEFLQNVTLPSPSPTESVDKE